MSGQSERQTEGGKMDRPYIVGPFRLSPRVQKPHVFLKPKAFIIGRYYIINKKNV